MVPPVDLVLVPVSFSPTLLGRNLLVLFVVILPSEIDLPSSAQLLLHVPWA